MVDRCEECKYFYEDKKEIRGIDGSVSYIPEFKCRKYHKIAKSVDGWVPRTASYTCPDFERRNP